MSHFLEQLDQFQQDYHRMLEEFQQRGQRELKQAFSSFFQTHPEIKSIYWTQYTPYFNDGDPCVFGINEICASTDEEVESFWDSNLDVASAEAVADFDKLVRCMGEMGDILEGVFGDHCSVVAGKHGFTVSEYDHD